MHASENSAALIHAVPAVWAERAHVNAAKYKDMYKFSTSEPDSFWAYHGKRIDWIKPFTKAKKTCFDPGNISIKWFEDGTTNVASNCIDRHLAKRAEQVAIIWEGDDPNEIAENEVDALGDISTLADPAVVSDLIKNRQPPKVSSK
jgi:acetyl-CoA synthetase